jgi:hypothetical protein
VHRELGELEHHSALLFSLHPLMSFFVRLQRVAESESQRAISAFHSENVDTAGSIPPQNPATGNIWSENDPYTYQSQDESQSNGQVHYGLKRE